jgi:hypothetical protein
MHHFPTIDGLRSDEALHKGRITREQTFENNTMIVMTHHFDGSAEGQEEVKLRALSYSIVACSCKEGELKDQRCCKIGHGRDKLCQCPVTMQ